MRTIAASLALLGASAVLGTSVTAAPPGSAVQEIRLISRQTSNHPGKKSAWTSDLLNELRQFERPAGVKVGAEVGFAHGAQLDGALRLPGGVVAYSGKARHLPRDAGIVVAVVDGSGAFAGVTGTYTRSRGDRSHPKSTIVVLRLRFG